MKQLPNESEMYQALVDRNPEYEGIFWVCVHTTGIFCRPTCPARKPNRENIEFVGSIQQALQSGFRPCRRCRPLHPDNSAPDWLPQLLDRLQQEPLARITDKQLRQWSIHPATVRRQFKQRYGITFQAYQRAHKMGNALQCIRNGQTTSSVAYDTGYESESGFREAFNRVFGDPPGKTSDLRPLITTELKTPLGSMIAIASDSGLCLLEFLDRRMIATQIKRIRDTFQTPILPGEHRHLQQTREELRSYFAGELTEFQIPLKLQGTAFQNQVWNELLKIPYAATRSYSQIADAVGRPNARRAIGRTNGDNRIAIIIPCHRVIRSDGSLCGYGGGVWRKQWLLEHEQSGPAKH